VPLKHRQLEAIPSKLLRLIAFQNKHNANADASSGAYSPSLYQAPQLEYRWSAQSPVLLPDLHCARAAAAAGCTGGAPRKQDDGLRKNKQPTDKAKDKVIPG
jgi:hypothetical protein